MKLKLTLKIMEEIVTYLLKSSGLLATFFLAYYFLLRKETFFTSNRWFLLSGLFASILLPLFFITKIVYVESPKITLPVATKNNDLPVIIDKATPIPTEGIDWLQILLIVYGIVATILIIKVIIDMISLAKLLRKQTIQKQEDLSYININQDIAPFSFFNYIVFNSSLYSQEELKSILLHETIHSKEKHSIDVMVAKLFTIVFWFNPLVWLYQKAIIQNLEYIADSKAIQNIEDKKCYQLALLKVVTHQNCLSITNHFYQSLIKKRIVMLNKNQSNKRNIWKYALILPVITAFVFLFQIKVVAQEKQAKAKKELNNTVIDSVKAILVKTMTDKDATDSEMKEDSRILKEQHGIDYTFSKIKRNAKGEITAIKIEFDDHKGHKGTSETDGDEPIEPIYFTIDEDKIGFSDTNDLSGFEVDEKLSKQFGTEIKVKKITSQKGYPIPPPPPPTPPVGRKKISYNKTEINEEKNRFYIINGKEYFQNELKGYTLKCDGSITYYDEEEAVKKFGEKAKDGAMVFDGVTTLEKINISKEMSERKTIIFSNDNGDDIVFIPSEKILKLPRYPSIRLNDEGLVLTVNGVQKSNPLETLNQMNLQNVKLVRVYDENGKETPGSQTKKIVITTK